MAMPIVGPPFTTILAAIVERACVPVPCRTPLCHSPQYRSPSSYRSAWRPFGDGGLSETAGTAGGVVDAQRCEPEDCCEPSQPHMSQRTRAWPACFSQSRWGCFRPWISAVLGAVSKRRDARGAEHMLARHELDWRHPAEARLVTEVRHIPFDANEGNFLNTACLADRLAVDARHPGAVEQLRRLKRPSHGSGWAPPGRPTPLAPPGRTGSGPRCCSCTSSNGVGVARKPA